MRESIEIHITENGARRVIRAFGDIRRSAGAAASGVSALNTALAALAGVMGVSKLMQWADRWATANGMIKTVTHSTEEYKTAQKELFEVAQRTRTGLAEMADLYGRVARASDGLGMSQKDTMQFTESVGKALVVQGRSTAQVSGALLQLGQLMTGNKVQAQEYNSLIDQTPVILNAVAQGWKGGAITVAELTARVKASTVTTKEFYDAFMAGAPMLEEQFAKMPLTFGQAMTVFGNAMTKLWGELNETFQISDKFGEVVKWISNHIEELKGVLGGLAAAIATAFSILALKKFEEAIIGLFNLIAAHPIGALAVAFSYLAVQLELTNAKLRETQYVTIEAEDAFQNLADMASSMWDSLAKDVESATSDMDTSLSGFVADSLSQLGGWASDAWDSMSHFFDDTAEGWEGLPEKVGKVMDALYTLVSAGVIWIGQELEIAVTTVGNTIHKAVTMLSAGIRGILASVAEGIGNILSMIGFTENAVGKWAADQNVKIAQLYDEVQAKEQKLNDLKANAKSFGDIATDIAADRVVNGMQALARQNNLKTKVDKSAQKMMADMMGGGVGLTNRLAEKGGGTKPTKPFSGLPPKKKGGGGGGKKKGGKGGKSDAEKEAEKWQKSFDSLMDSLFPVDKAIQDYKDKVTLLNEAHAKGLIPTEKLAQAMQVLGEKTEGARDPLGKWLKDKDEEMKFLKMSADAREKEKTIEDTIKKMKEAGLQVGEAEKKQIREKIEAYEELNRVVKIQDSLLENSLAKQSEDFNKKVDVIKNMLASNTKGFSKDDAIEDVNKQFGNVDALQGTQEYLDYKLALNNTYYEKLDKLRKADLISEQSYAQARWAIMAEEHALKTQGIKDLFGELAFLSKSGNRKLAAIGKAAAATQATIDGVVAVQKALASAPPPLNYAIAASVGVSTALNVAKILGANTGFMTGGSFKVGGSGGADSQLVAFRASPGEHVQVRTPEQVRKGDTNNYQNSGQVVQGNITIINVLDKGLVGEYMSTKEGERVVVNTIERNAQQVKGILS